MRSEPSALFPGVHVSRPKLVNKDERWQRSSRAPCRRPACVPQLKRLARSARQNEVETYRAPSDRPEKLMEPHRVTGITGK